MGDGERVSEGETERPTCYERIYCYETPISCALKMHEENNHTLSFCCFFDSTLVSLIIENVEVFQVSIRCASV